MSRAAATTGESLSPLHTRSLTGISPLRQTATVASRKVSDGLTTDHHFAISVSTAESLCPIFRGSITSIFSFRQAAAEAGRKEDRSRSSGASRTGRGGVPGVAVKEERSTAPREEAARGAAATRGPKSLRPNEERM